MFGRSKMGLAEAAEVLGALLDVPPESIVTFVLIGIAKDGGITFSAGENLPPNLAAVLLEATAAALTDGITARRIAGEQN